MKTQCSVREARHNRSHRFHVYEMSRTGKSEETQADRSLQVLGEEGMGSDYFMGIGFYDGLLKVFWNLTEVMVSQH